MSKQINIGGRIHSTEVGNVAVGANEVHDDTKGKKQNVINSETDAELLRLDQSKQNNLTFDNTPTENSSNPVKSSGVYAADKALSDAIEAILLLIPSAATALNQLADKAFVNSSVSTATATFRGTYNVVTDLELAYDATHEQIATKLGQVIATADNNDYAFVQIPVSATSTDIRRTERYKFNGTVCGYEYDLNTSGFTQAQWEAINSAITAALVQKLSALPTAQELAAALLGKQDVLTFDNVPTTDSSNPVKSGGVKSAINDEKVARENADTGLGNRITAIENVIPSAASSSNKLVDNSAMSDAIGVVTALIGQMDATFNLTTTDGHITLHVTQENGVITSVQVQSSDIASAAALTLVTNRVTTAEGNITSLGGRVSTNEMDIANLQQLYNNLQQSKPVPVTALPETGQQQEVIYRLAGTTSYSDYMWNGSTWVLMATYNNAIDPRPKKASQNLVTSGGVFDNMGALDVSELNATENPHTLAQYADLPAALAVIPTDYQKGGMSIKFVQSSDNKYVQFRLMSDTFNTTPANWQGVDDVPTAGSKNLVESGGTKLAIEKKYKLTNDYEFAIVDKNHNAVVLFNGGHIKTKKFDSKNVEGLGQLHSVRDFAVVDKNDNAVLVCDGGHVRTKYFNSAEVSGKLAGLKLSLLGDSITTFDGKLVPNDLGMFSYYPSGNVQNWQDTYWGLLVKNDGMILDSNCASSGSFVHGDSQLAMCSDDRLALLGNPDVIIFYGGTNDFCYDIPVGNFNYNGDYSAKSGEFKAAYAYCLYKMKTMHPNAKIVCVTLPDFSGLDNRGHENDYPIHNTYGNLHQMFEDYNACIRELAHVYNAAICDIGTSIPYFSRSLYYNHDSDGSYVHPNMNGMDVIYNRIKKILRDII